MTTGPPPHESTSPPASRVLFWSYSVLSGCLAAGYGVLFTVVGDYRDAYGISETSIGWVIGIGFIVAFVSQVAIAPIGDRGHARKLVLAGVAVNALGLILLGTGDDLPTIMAGRIISGLAIGAANPAIRRIVVAASEVDLGRNLGRLLSADVFGFAMGPAVSAVLVGPFGLGAPFYVIAGASIIAVGATLWVQVEEVEDRSGRRFAVDLLRDRPFAGAVVLGATAYLMIGAFDALWDVVHVDLGTANWLANLGITLFAVPLIILGPVGGRLAQDLGPFRMAAAGLSIAAVFMASYGVLPSGGWIFSLAMVHAITDGLTFAASGVAVGLTAPAERQSGAQGVLGAAQALAAGIMAVVAGALYEGAGRATAYFVAASMMIVLVAIGLALASSVWLRRARPAPARAPVGGWPQP